MAELIHTNYQIRWRNFRRFEDTGWITLRPITVLIGANNSGKSSVLSPLLLLNQTLLSRDNQAPLVPRGPLIDLGNYKDFVHLHDVQREICLGLRFHIHPEPTKIRPVGNYPPGAVELTFTVGDEPQQTKLKRYELSDIFGRPYISRGQAKDSRFSLAGIITLDKMNDREQKAIALTKPVNFLFSPNATLYQLDVPEKPEEQTKPTRFSESFSHYLQTVGSSYSGVRSLFHDLSYIGPLRQKLRRYYRISSEIPATVGPQGENAPNLFRRKRPQLQADLNKWIRRFEFGDSLTYEQPTDDIFQLVFKDGPEQTNVADVGFGASQVLPLIIQALAAPQDSLTLAEQPEIHLNPRLQSVLADLFVQMARLGHRVLVETHSEHLLTRLRTLVASKEVSETQVAVYFVERQGRNSTIREIPIEGNGHIPRDAWPKGFFEDALRESLELANAQAKRRKNK